MLTDKTDPGIAVVMAMEQEAAGLVKALGLERFTPHPRYQETSFLFFRGTYRRLRIHLVLPGEDPRFKRDKIGTESAAVAAFAAVREFDPDLLINAGTCGSFAAAGAQIGKVYLSESAFYFHDRRIPLPGWERYALGGYPSLDVKALAAKMGLETANVSSGNSLDYTDQELAVMRSNGAILKEMEAGAIAGVAFATKTPFFALKSVTNLIDTNPDSPSEFEKNFSLAVAALDEKWPALFEALAASI